MSEQYSIRLRGNEISLAARDAQLLHAEVKRGSFDSQSCGRTVGTGDNPPSLLENFANVVSLRVFQCNRPHGFHFGGIGQACEKGLQDVARSDDYAPFDEILELANVSRPLESDDRCHGFKR